MRGVFDIVGPVMIGPSSSHTAGAVRLGLMAGKILGERAVKAGIQLHGSFARTGKGHGTDKALLAGIMGFLPDDERIRDAQALAQQQGLEYSFQTVDFGDVHPNTVLLHLVGVSGRIVSVGGASIGGGNILITKINGYAVELTGEYPALLVLHRDRPGVILQVAGILARRGLNVAFMRVSRQARGQESLMILEMDEALPAAVVDECCSYADIEQAMAIPAI